MEKNTLVTITRQYGSGGREVADLVAKKMGVRRYDRKVVAMAAQNIGEENNFHDLIERSYNAPENCMGNLGDYAYVRVPMHNRMYIEQAKVILGVAKEGSAVFLGRCADYILKDHPNTFSFFIYAMMSSVRTARRRIMPAIRLKTSMPRISTASSTMHTTRAALGAIRRTTTS